MESSKGKKEHERSKELKNKDSTTQMRMSVEQPRKLAPPPTFTSYLAELTKTIKKNRLPYAETIFTAEFYNSRVVSSPRLI